MKAHAEEQHLSQHAAILRLIKIGLERVTHPVTTPQVSAQIGQLKPETIARPKPKNRARWSLKSVPLASDVHAPYGSRLKTTKAKK